MLAFAYYLQVEKPKLNIFLKWYISVKKEQNIQKYIYSERYGSHLSKTSTRSKIPSLHFENGRVKKKQTFFRIENFSKSENFENSLKSLSKCDDFRKFRKFRKSKNRNFENFENFKKTKNIDFQKF